jgi:hypothetical protein
LYATLKSLPSASSATAPFAVTDCTSGTGVQGRPKSTALLFGSTENIRFSLQMTTDNLQKMNVMWVEKPEWIVPNSKLKLKNENPLLYGQLIEKEKNSWIFCVEQYVVPADNLTAVVTSKNKMKLFFQ